MRGFSITLTLLVLLSACNGRSPLLPRSGGRPYEVLIVGDKDSLLHRALNGNVNGLPQPEPLFDISTTDKEHFNQTAKLARNIVILDVDANKYTQTRIRYDQNVYAEPQLIAYVHTPSVADLNQDMTFFAPRLNNLLAKAEFSRETNNLKRNHNVKAEEEIRKMFGCEMLVPSDLMFIKKGKDFIWISNNSAHGMKNIVLFLPNESMEKRGESIGTITDSALKANIPGEEDGMYMQLAHHKFLNPDNTFANEPDPHVTCALPSYTEWRGLWEMKGDAMGGPIFIRKFTSGKNRKTFFGMAFIYAPDMKKRNMMRQLEAALSTLKE